MRIIVMKRIWRSRSMENVSGVGLGMEEEFGS